MNPTIQNIGQTQPSLPLNQSSEVAQPSETNFSKTLESMLSTVNDQQIAGDKAIEQLQTGDASHLHEVMIAMEEADISLRMLVQIRNRALTAYDEIMRMQL